MQQGDSILFRLPVESVVLIQKIWRGSLARASFRLKRPAFRRISQLCGKVQGSINALGASSFFYLYEISFEKKVREGRLHKLDRLLNLARKLKAQEKKRKEVALGRQVDGATIQDTHTKRYAEQFRKIPHRKDRRMKVLSLLSYNSPELRLEPNNRQRHELRAIKRDCWRKRWNTESSFESPKEQ